MVPLLSALEDEHDIRRDVARQVMAWFGRISEDGSTWAMDVDAVVRDVGLGILRAHHNEPTPDDAFLEQWRKAVGDTFAEKVSLTLLLVRMAVFCPSAVISFVLTCSRNTPYRATT